MCFKGFRFFFEFVEIFDVLIAWRILRVRLVKHIDYWGFAWSNTLTIEGSLGQTHRLLRVRLVKHIDYWGFAWEFGSCRPICCEYWGYAWSNASNIEGTLGQTHWILRVRLATHTPIVEGKLRHTYRRLRIRWVTLIEHWGYAWSNTSNIEGTPGQRQQIFCNMTKPEGTLGQTHRSLRVRLVRHIEHWGYAWSNTSKTEGTLGQNTLTIEGTLGLLGPNCHKQPSLAPLKVENFEKKQYNTLKGPKSWPLKICLLSN